MSGFQQLWQIFTTKLLRHQFQSVTFNIQDTSTLHIGARLNTKMKHYYVTNTSRKFVVLSRTVQAMTSSTCIVSRYCVTSDMHAREYLIMNRTI